MVAYLFDQVPDIARQENSGVQVQIGKFALTAALSNTTSDTIGNIPIPSGSVITGVTLATEELDTNASPTMTLDVGDATDPNRFISAATTGDPANFDTINVISDDGSDIVDTGYGYEYTADDNILITVGADPATGATAGSVVLVVEYTNDAF